MSYCNTLKLIIWVKLGRREGFQTSLKNLLYSSVFHPGFLLLYYFLTSFGISNLTNMEISWEHVRCVSNS